MLFERNLIMLEIFKVILNLEGVLNKSVLFFCFVINVQLCHNHNVTMAPYLYSKKCSSCTDIHIAFFI